MVAIINSCTFGKYNKKYDFKLQPNSQSHSQSGVIVFKIDGVFEYKKSKLEKLIKVPKNNVGQIIYQNTANKNKVYGSEFDAYDMRMANFLVIPMFVITLASFGVVPVITFGKRYSQINPSQYIALEVPAGTYSLPKIITTDNQTIKIQTKNFEVKNQEVVYLGDLSVNFHHTFFKTHTCVEAVDNFESIKNVIYNKFPNIQNYDFRKNLLENKNDFCNLS